MSQENVERLRAVYSKWAKGNFRAGGDLFAQDIVYEPMSDGRDAYVGRDAVEKQMREFLAQWSAFRVEAQEFVEIGDAVLVIERQHGTGKSSGIETEMTSTRSGSSTKASWYESCGKPTDLKPSKPPGCGSRGSLHTMGRSGRRFTVAAIGCVTMYDDGPGRQQRALRLIAFTD